MSGPLSLFSYARNILIKYINTIDDVGDMEYRILEPVLKKITSPHQLKKLELNSPQIAGEDMELWKKFIARDFGVDAVDKFVPKNPKSWSKVYDKHQKEATLAQERAAELLKAQFQALNSSKESGRTHLVNASALPPLRRSKPWGSGGGGGGSGGGGGGGGGGWNQSANSWDAKIGSKTKNIIQKARREAKQISVFQGVNSRLAIPTSKLGTGSVSDTMKRRIKSAEEIRSEREKIAEQSRSNGRASGALGKRKIADVVEGEDEHQEEDEAEKRRKADEWRKKAAERRGPPIATGAKARAVPEKKPTDPFFRPKKVATNPLAIPARRR